MDGVRGRNMVRMAEKPPNHDVKVNIYNNIVDGLKELSRESVIDRRRKCEERILALLEDGLEKRALKGEQVSAIAEEFVKHASVNSCRRLEEIGLQKAREFLNLYESEDENEITTHRDDLYGNAFEMLECVAFIAERRNDFVSFDASCSRLILNGLRDDRIPVALCFFEQLADALSDGAYEALCAAMQMTAYQCLSSCSSEQFDVCAYDDARRIYRCIRDLQGDDAPNALDSLADRIIRRTEWGMQIANNRLKDGYYKEWIAILECLADWGNRDAKNELAAMQEEIDKAKHSNPSGIPLSAEVRLVEDGQIINVEDELIVGEEIYPTGVYVNSSRWGLLDVAMNLTNNPTQQCDSFSKSDDDYSQSRDSQTRSSRSSRSQSSDVTL